MIQAHIYASVRVAENLLTDVVQIGNLHKAADRIFCAFLAHKKLLICGNGGSAADAQHIAAEFVGRYKTERRGLAAIALTTDTSCLTAISNDYGFDQVFERQVDAIGAQGDVLLALSTSGKSPNVLRAMERADEIGMEVIGFTSGPPRRDFAVRSDILFAPMCTDTAITQQLHLMAAHAICGQIDDWSLVK
jgi:D-sedoheptulose 7-phosphate isomerase